MSNEEILQACNLRLRNWSWDDIGRKLHYSGKNVRYQVETYVIGERKFVRGCGKYPHIKLWLQKNRMSAEDLAKAFGCSRAYIYQILSCHRPMPEDFVQWMLVKSDLTEAQIREKESPPPSADRRRAQTKTSSSK